MSLSKQHSPLVSHGNRHRRLSTDCLSLQEECMWQKSTQQILQGKDARPPKFAWFPATCEQTPGYTSAEGRQKYENKIDKIGRLINFIFYKLNKPNNFSTSVGFHLMGLTINTKTDALLGRSTSSTATTSLSWGGTTRRALRNVSI